MYDQLRGRNDSASKHATGGVATTISVPLDEEMWVQLNKSNSLKQLCMVGYYGSSTAQESLCDATLC